LNATCSFYSRKAGQTTTYIQPTSNFKSSSCFLLNRLFLYEKENDHFFRMIIDHSFLYFKIYFSFFHPKIEHESNLTPSTSRLLSVLAAARQKCFAVLLLSKSKFFFHSVSLLLFLLSRTATDSSVMQLCSSKFHRLFSDSSNRNIKWK